MGDSQVKRRIVRTGNAPMGPGFLGPNHRAAMRVSPEEFEANDPFFLLMDDNVEAGEAFAPMGEAHPHAGFETVTLLLDGSIRDRHEGGVLGAGDLQWMTAGKGVIHSEDIEARGKLRILQLWLTLPRRDRWTAPGFQEVRATALPVRREPGVEVRLYSGSSGDVRSATRNHVPVTLAEIRVEPHASFEQDLPADYNGFVLVIEGSVQAGVDGAVLKVNEIGWLDRPADRGASSLRLVGGGQGARLVLYAGERQGAPIVSHGPFIGDTREDIVRLFNEYRQGRFQRMSELAAQR
jgi:redox-sensitive bicupin YhaK (pirin superfamily)